MMLKRERERVKGGNCLTQVCLEGCALNRCVCRYYCDQDWSCASGLNSIMQTLFTGVNCNWFCYHSFFVVLERAYSSSRNIPPSFTVRRTFTLRNTGPLPIYIDKMLIGSAECEGYGFKVIDCRSFDLPPNDSHKVDIMLVSVETEFCLLSFSVHM